MSNAHKRLDYIHGLRGVAALMVIVQHSLEIVQQAGVDTWQPLLESVNLGRFGVILFFLISGLVIPYSFKGAKPLRSFAVSRVLRLYPAYWVSIAVLAGFGVLRSGEPTWTLLAANATMLQEFAGFRNLTPVYWTLTLELAFYALCAALFALRLLHNPRVTSLIVLGMLGLAVMPAVARAYGADMTGYPPALPILFAGTRPYCVAMFFVGLLIRQAMVEQDPVARRHAYAIVPLAFAAGLVMGGVLAVQGTQSAFFQPLAMATSMALPIALFVLVLWWKPTPWQPLMYLGTVSYSLYLFQDVGLIGLPEMISAGNWPVAFVLTVTLLTLGIAALVYHLVEQPAIALGRRLTGRTTPATRQPASSTASSAAA